MDNGLKVTVITVVYNEAQRIQKTIESVLSQDYDNIEYIIKDGGSTDGTLDVIADNAYISDKIRYVSCKDCGIYDAMNHALALATGDVIHFLNAGDRYASFDVISVAAKVMRETGSDIVYGDVVYEYADGSTNVRSYPQSCSKKIYYLTGDVINHQVIFARFGLFKGNLFDTSYKICADREWLMRIGAYSPRLKMTSLGFPIAVYPLDGISVINKKEYKKEADICIKKHMPYGYPIYAIFEFFRSKSIFASVLHGIYKKIYYKR